MIGEAVSCDNPAAPTNGGFADAAEYRISYLDISEVNQTESVQDMKDEWDETSEEETEPEDSQKKSVKSSTEKSAKIVGVESFNVAEESSNVDDINDTVEGESVPILEAVSENTGDMENQANKDTNNVAVSEQQDQDSSVDVIQHVEAVTESKDNGEAAKESDNADKAADNNMAAPESINAIEKVSPKASGETIASEKGSCEDLAVEKAVAADEKAATEGAAAEKAVIEGATAEKAVIKGAAAEKAAPKVAAAEKAVIEAVTADKIPQTDGLEDEDIKVSFILYF